MSVSGARNTRRVERSALTALLPVVVLFPVFLMAMVVFWLPLRFVFGIPYWVVPLAWVAAAVLLFVPAVQVALLARFLGTRPPTPDERLPCRCVQIGHVRSIHVVLSWV